MAPRVKKPPPPAPAPAPVRPPPRSEAERLADEVVAQCVCARLLQVTRVVAGHYDRSLRKLGVTGNQVVLLSVIAALRRCTPADLEPILQMDRSTVSRNLSRLVSAGLVTKIPGRDRRTWSAVLSAKGEELLVRAVPVWRESQAWAEELIGRQGTEAIRRVARRTNEHLP